MPFDKYPTIVQWIGYSIIFMNKVALSGYRVILERKTRQLIFHPDWSFIQKGLWLYNKRISRLQWIGDFR